MDRARRRRRPRRPRSRAARAEWIVKTAEQFWTGLGLQPLPATFWKNSDLYPVQAGDPRKKNTHASCWHIDLDERHPLAAEHRAERGVVRHRAPRAGARLLLHEPTRGPRCRRCCATGANPAFHEGMAELGALAARQVPYLQRSACCRRTSRPTRPPFLLNDALANTVPFMFWASGTMTHWEADVYASNLPPDQWNARWWQYVARFPGRRAARAARRGVVRRRHQDAHQRQPPATTQLRHRHGAASSSSTTTSPGRSSTSRPQRLQLRRATRRSARS